MRRIDQRLERHLGVAVEGSVQRAFDFSAAAWVLSNLYLLAQLVVVPGVLDLVVERARIVERRDQEPSGERVHHQEVPVGGLLEQLDQLPPGVGADVR